MKKRQLKITLKRLLKSYRWCKNSSFQKLIIALVSDMENLFLYGDSESTKEVV